MAAHHHRHALWLLLPVNTAALAAGLAVAQGAVTLPVPLPAVHAAPERGHVQAAARPTTGPRVDTPRADRLPPPEPTATGTVTAARTTLEPAAGAAPPARRVTRSRHPASSFEQELQQQIGRIPLYKPGVARWVVIPDLAVYGATRLSTRTIYLSPRIPRRLLYSVVVHEWGHVISTHAYDGDLRASQQAFRRWFGGRSLAAATERAADCIAVLLSATWTHYTSCRDDRWRLGALYLANGMKLPAQS